MAQFGPYGFARFSFSPDNVTLHPNTIPDMLNAGLSRMRLQLKWAFLEDPAATFHWTNLDDIVKNLNNAKLAITFVIESQPIYSTSHSYYYSSGNAGQFSGTIKSGGDAGSSFIQLTSNATSFYPSNSARIIVSGGGNPPEIVGVNVSSGSQPTGFVLTSPLQYGQRTSVQWYAYPDPTATANFAFTVASRYNGRNQHGFIDAIEIGNEEYDSQGENYHPDANTILDAADGLVRVINVVSPVIRAASPSVKIGCAALWWNQLPHVGNKLANIYAGLSSKNLVDYYNFHFYPYESGANGSIDPLRPTMGAQTHSIIPSYPQQIAAMAAVMSANGEGFGKYIHNTEIGYYTAQYPRGRPIASACSSLDVQARNYFITLEIARKSGIVNGFDFWTMDYAGLTPDVTYRDAANNPMSDGDSLVQVSTAVANNVSTVSTVYLPAYYQIKAYTLRWPDFRTTLNNGHTFLAFDSFISVPATQNSPNTLINTNPRYNVTGNFGNPSDSNFAQHQYNSSGSGSYALSTVADWIHYGSGTGTQAFANDEGEIVSPSSAIEYFRLGTGTAVSQELVFRVTTAADNDLIGVCARLSGNGTDDTAVNCYRAYIYQGTLYLSRVVGGNNTILATTAVTYSNGSPYFMRFSVTGTAITVLSCTFWACDCTTAGNNVTVEPSTPTLTYTDTTGTLTSASGYGFAVLASSTTPIKFDTFMATQPNVKSYPDVSSRFVLAAKAKNDYATRLLLIIGTFTRRDMSTRLLLRSPVLTHDTLMRFRLDLGTTTNDAGMRLRLRSTRDVSTRLRLTSNPPTAPQIYADDTFVGRTLIGTLGTASDGSSVWTILQNANLLSVTGGYMQVATSGGYPFATLGTLAVSDLDVLMTFVPASSNDAIFNIVRYTDSKNFVYMGTDSGQFYLKKVVNGTTSLLGDSYVWTLTSGMSCSMRFRAVGSTFNGRIWLSANPEPTAWRITFIDPDVTGPGLYGIQSHNASGNSTNLLFDAYTVTSARPNSIACRFNLGLPAPYPASSNFVRRTNSTLMLDGAPYRFSGWNMFWIGLVEGSEGYRYPTPYEVQDALATAKEMGHCVIRAHTLGISTGHSKTLLTLWPTIGGAFNETAAVHIDYVIYQMGLYGLRTLIPLVDNYNYYHGGKHDFTDRYGLAEDQFYFDPRVIADFKTYVSFLVNRVNTYTGVTYKDDPTILAWQLGNELVYDPSKSGNYQPFAAWSQTMADFIKTLDSNHLIADGSYFIFPEHLAIGSIDIHDTHYYVNTNLTTHQTGVPKGTGIDLVKLANDAAQCFDAGKAYINGESDWSHPTLTQEQAYLDAISTNQTISGNFYWSLYPHHDGKGFTLYNDNGNTFHAPNFLDTTASTDTLARYTMIRRHAYAQRGYVLPASSLLPPPTVTSVFGGVAWNGVATALNYQLEKSTGGTVAGPWTVVGVYNDLQTPVNTPSNGLYRIKTANADGVYGPYTGGPGTYRDLTARFKLAVQQTKNLAARFILAIGAPASRNLTSRVVLRGNGFQNAVTRFILAVGGSQKNLTTRFVLNPGIVFRNAAMRLVLSAAPRTFAVDTFIGRAVNGSFGTASDTINTWATAHSDANSNISVGANNGRVSSQANGVTSVNRFVIGPSVTDVTLSVNIDSTNITGDAAGLLLHYQDDTHWYGLQLNNTGVNFVVNNAGVTTSPVKLFTPSNGVFYTLKVFALGNTYSCKVWDSTTVEPASYNAVISNNTFSSGQSGLFLYPNSSAGIQSGQFKAVYQPTVLKNIASRLVLVLPPVIRNVSSRLILSGAGSRNATTRTRLRSIVTPKDTSTRFRLTFPSTLRSIASRLLLNFSPQTYAVDTFAGRTTSNAFGTASDTVNTWATAYSDANSAISVSAGTGRVATLNNTITSYNRFTIGSSVTDVTVSAQVKMANVGSDACGLHIHYQDLSHWYGLQLSSSGVSFVINNGGVFTYTTVQFFTPNPASTYGLKVSAYGNTYLCKTWDMAGAEPAGYNVTVTDTLYGGGKSGLFFYPNSTSAILVSNFKEVYLPTVVPNLATRFKLQVSRMAVTRFLLAVRATRDVNIRMLLSSLAQRNTSTRTRLSDNAKRDTASRLPLSDNATRNLSNRFPLSAQKTADLFSRLKLKSAAMSQDIAQRFRLAGNAISDVKSRVNLAIQSLGDTSTRTRLKSALTNKDTASRFRLIIIGQAIDDVILRFSLLANASKNIASRVRIGVFTQIDATTRTLLQAQMSHDTATRFVVFGKSVRDAVTRTLLKAISVKDIASRLPLMAKNTSDIASRYRLSAKQYGNVASRVSIDALVNRDTTSRVKVSIANSRDAASRLLLKSIIVAQDAATRLRLVPSSSQNIATRARISDVNSGDITAFLKLIMAQFVDISTRFVLLATRSQGVATRINVAAASTTPPLPVVAHFRGGDSYGNSTFQTPIIWNQGQTLPALALICMEDDDSEFDLSDNMPSDVSIVIQSQNGTDFVGNGPLTIVSAAQGIMEYQFSPTDVATVGTFKMFVEIDSVDGLSVSDPIVFRIVAV